MIASRKTSGGPSRQGSDLKMAEAKKTDRSKWWLAVVGAAGVISGALVTGLFNYLEHKSDVDAKMIELSIGILRTQPTSETIPLREWAIDVMDKRAGFSFSEQQRAVLLKNELPFKSEATWIPPGAVACRSKNGGLTSYCAVGSECAPEGGCIPSGAVACPSKSGGPSNYCAVGYECTPEGNCRKK